MFILDLMRYMKGSVYFKISGDFAERFFNLAARERIALWDCKRESGSLHAYASAKSYRKLRGIAKKTGVRIRIEEKRGIPFTRRRYRRRWGLLAGFGMFLAFLIVMSLFLWRIDVEGLETIPESRVLQTLEELGVHPGSLRRGIDVRESERRMLMLMPELSFIAINIDGSTAAIELSERSMPPVLIDAHAPCNLVARKAGQITAINVYEGQALVSVGDAVTEGDLLISGVTQDGAGNNLFRHARGEVMARVEHTVALDIPLDQIRYTPTGEIKNRGSLEIFGLNLPLFLPIRVEGFYYVERGEEDIRPLGIPLPVKLYTRKLHMMEEETVRLTESMAREQALKELRAAEAIELAGGEILERSLRALISGGVYTIEAKYICIMDISLAREIIVSD
ncbi:MAG: sporulation protein YqfD [Oscillospiraceae bacterium]|nr:sporulation protein YqfD [Oscillospiraceae bacterium]